nr:hypothetical protein [uncultured Flavobacterium sp.]
MYIVITIVLFSCQNKEDKLQKVKKNEVSIDTLTAKTDVLDTTSIIKKKPNQSPSDLSKAKQTELKQTTPISYKEVDKNKSSKSEKEKKDDAPLAVKAPLNSNAEFPGGIDQFHTFFLKEYKKPEGINYWKLNFTLAFAVEKNGSVSFLECSPAVEEPLEKEIIRILSLCPKWLPGESNGKKIRMQYSVPIFLK